MNEVQGRFPSAKPRWTRPPAPMVIGPRESSTRRRLTITHELGHLLGLDDYPATSNACHGGPGFEGTDPSVMCQGNPFARYLHDVDCNLVKSRAKEIVEGLPPSLVEAYVPPGPPSTKD